MLKRSTLALMGIPFLVCLLAPTAQVNADKDGKDDVLGARWHYVIDKKGDDNEDVEKGVFRVYKKVIYRKDRKVGLVHASSPTETKLEINDLPELNGTAKLRKVDAKPPVWKGVLVRKDGTKWKMTVEMRDR